MGVFITLEPPSEDMKVAAISDGFYTSEMWQQQYPKIQILTIEELLSGSQIQMPPSGYGAFKQAPKEKKKEGKQTELDL